MLTVHPDNATTRRKSHHYVLDENEDLVWTGARVSDLFVFMYETEQVEFLMQTKEILFNIKVFRVKD